MSYYWEFVFDVSSSISSKDLDNSNMEHRNMQKMKVETMDQIKFGIRYIEIKLREKTHQCTQFLSTYNNKRS